MPTYFGNTGSGGTMAIFAGPPAVGVSLGAVGVHGRRSGFGAVAVHGRRAGFGAPPVESTDGKAEGQSTDLAAEIKKWVSIAAGIYNQFTGSQQQQPAPTNQYQQGYRPPIVQVQSASPAATPAWVLPVAIGGGALVVGTVVVLALKKRK